MNTIAMSDLIRSENQDSDIFSAAQSLGRLLIDTPEYEAFLSALKAVNNDLELQRLSAKIREHNRALQWWKGDAAEHHSALERLANEMEALPVMSTYRTSEQNFVRFIREIDQVISASAGVGFAANAKSSGCGCGGSTCS